jgi:diguanylate cyclase (GGDEF)-like protein
MMLHEKIEEKNHLQEAYIHAIRKTKLGKYLFVAFIDVDDLKSVNDTKGHIVGDKIITRIASLIASNTRKEDRIVRFGGDEFVVFLPNVSGNIRSLVNRICEAVEQDKLLRKLVGGMEVSIGVAVHDPAKHRSVEDLVNEADQLMYKAKACIDTRVVYHEDDLSNVIQLDFKKKALYSWVIFNVRHNLNTKVSKKKIFKAMSDIRDSDPFEFVDKVLDRLKE